WSDAGPVPRRPGPDYRGNGTPVYRARSERLAVDRLDRDSVSRILDCCHTDLRTPQRPLRKEARRARLGFHLHWRFGALRAVTNISRTHCRTAATRRRWRRPPLYGPRRHRRPCATARARPLPRLFRWHYDHSERPRPAPGGILGTRTFLAVD